MPHQNIQPFGVVVVASPGDYLFAKGTCASIRYFMPDVPIAMIVDGSINTDALEQTYAVKVIRKSDIDHPWLQKHSFGWGITKMLAFWYAPFEYFLYLDSDTLVWGDIRTRINVREYDYIADIPYYKIQSDISDQEIDTWFFEPAFVEQHFPDFPWKQYKERFMCPGTFFARRDAFAIEDYKEMLSLKLKYPYSLHFGDMGFHNIMVFRNFHHAKLNLGFLDFQVIFPDFPQDQLKQRFRFKDEHPIVDSNDIQVLHMPDKKPLVNNPNCYSLPMTYFRLKFIEDTEGFTGETAMNKLLAEDREYFQLRRKSLRRHRLNIIRKLLMGHPEEWRHFTHRLGNRSAQAT